MTCSRVSNSRRKWETRSSADRRPTSNQVLGVDGRLAGKRPEHRGGKFRRRIEKTEQPREGDWGDGAIAERGNRIQCSFREGAGKADEVSRKRDVQYLATAVVEYPAADRDTVDQYQ
jgi:hypothetical protein